MAGRGIREPCTNTKRSLLKLSVRDDAYVDELLAGERATAASHLDPKTEALVRVGALVAVDAAPPSYMQAIECARASSASNEEIVGCLIAVLPVVGVARIVSAAPKIGLPSGTTSTPRWSRRRPAAPGAEPPLPAERGDRQYHQVTFRASRDDR